MRHSNLDPTTGKKVTTVGQVFARLAVVTVNEDATGRTIAIEMEWSDILKELTDLVKVVQDAKAGIAAGSGFWTLTILFGNSTEIPSS